MDDYASNNWNVVMCIHDNLQLLNLVTQDAFYYQLQRQSIRQTFNSYNICYNVSCEHVLPFVLV